MFQTLDNKVYNRLCFCWRILFSSGCRFRKTLLGVPSDHRIFPKRFLFLPLPGWAALSFSFNRPLPQSGRATDNFGFIWCCPYLSAIKYFTRKGSKSGNLLPVSLPKCKFYFPIRTQSELDQLEVYRVYQHQGKILSSCLRLPLLRWN